MLSGALKITVNQHRCQTNDGGERSAELMGNCGHHFILLAGDLYFTNHTADKKYTKWNGCKKYYSINNPYPKRSRDKNSSKQNKPNCNNQGFSSNNFNIK